MKTLRLMGFGLFAVLLSFTFASCDPNNDPDPVIPEPPTPEKRLAKMTIEEVEVDGSDTQRWIETTLFNYDDQGRVAYVNTYYNNNEISNTIEDSYTISYSNNEITCNRADVYEKETFRLSNGKIIQATEDFEYFTYTHSYEYNSQNYLSEIIGNYDRYTLTWNGTQLASVKESDTDGEQTFYNFNYDKTCKGYNPVVVLELAHSILYEGEIFPIITNPELAGIKTTHLVKESDEIEVDDDTEEKEYKYTYELYDDGYLKSCRVQQYEDGEADDYIIYNFTWE